MVPKSQVAKVRCELRLEFSSDAEAQRIHRAVAADNDEHVRSWVHGNAIMAEMEADSAKSLLHTLEDLLCCMSVADRIVARKP